MNEFLADMSGTPDYPRVLCEAVGFFAPMGLALHCDKRIHPANYPHEMWSSGSADANTLVRWRDGCVLADVLHPETEDE